MEKQDLERYLLTSRGKSVCVDVEELPEFPGHVRTVTVLQGPSVHIEFNSLQYDEGGPCFVGDFSSLEALIESLEDYLRRPLSDWRPCWREEAREPEPGQSKEGGKRLVEAISAGRVPLPRVGRFVLKEGYWSRFLRQ